MCLVSETDIPSIAKEDFIVYKVFAPDNRSLVSDFDYSPYIGKRFDDTNEERIQYSEGKYLIDKGFIHSCRNIGTALILAHVAEAFHYKTFEEIVDFVIRECIIPKGAQFYFNESEIASKSIIIGEVCV